MIISQGFHRVICIRTKTPNFVVSSLFIQFPLPFSPLDAKVSMANVPTDHTSVPKHRTWPIFTKGSRFFHRKPTDMPESKSLEVLQAAGDIVLGAVGTAIPPSEKLDHMVRYLGTWSGSEYVLPPPRTNWFLMRLLLPSVSSPVNSWWCVFSNCHACIMIR